MTSSGLAFSVALALVTVAAAAGGDLDPSFGSSGKVTTNLGGFAVADAVAIEPDGKIVAAGFTRGNLSADFALVRYNRDGRLDTTFGSGGVVTTAFGNRPFEDDFAYSVAIQADQKIVVAGVSNANDAGGDFAIARYNRDGSLDTSFGDGGKVLTDFVGSDLARAVDVQPDGKIIAAGQSQGNGFDFALARYNRDGSLDPGFGSGGKVLTDFGGFDSANAVAVQPNGTIVAAGVGGAGFQEFALARYRDDGSLDATFGSGGKVTTDFNVGDCCTAVAANAVAMRPNGQIVAAGQSFGLKERFVLARYTRHGALDDSFGSDGRVVTDFGPLSDSEARGVAAEPDGKVVAAGYALLGGGGDVFAVARYNRNGSLDATFGSAGTVTTDFGPIGQGVGNAVAVRPDGRIVVAGESSAGPSEDFTLTRYLP